MNDEIRRQVERLASRIVTSYFCEAEVEFMLSTFTPDIVWLGAGENQRAEGAEAVAACFRAGQGDLFPCNMQRERYVTRELAPGCYLCQGDSWIQPKLETQRYFQVHQRVTFVFRQTEDGLRTAYIHNSVSFADLLKDELFPVQASVEAYKRLEGLLAQKDNQIELMLSQLPGGMLICAADADFSIKWISDSLYGMLGFADMQDFVDNTGCACRGFIVPEDFDDMRRQVDQELGRGGAYDVEYRVRRKDGEVFWASDLGKIVEDADGQKMIYCFISDITERKSRELELVRVNREVRRKADFLSQLYDTVPCGILQFTTDGAHAIVNVNRMVWEFYGFSSEEDYRAAVKSPFDLVLEKDRKEILAVVDGLELDGETVSYTRESARRDGTRVWISVVMQRLINADGREVIQAVFSDITSIHNLQTAREQERLLENRSLRAAICTAYPLIMSVNLTRDTYNCFIEDHETYFAERRGSYDALIRKTEALAYSAYREDFRASFGRDMVLKKFADGERQIYMELQLQDMDQKYHWISVNLIYVENPFDHDVLAIELVKLLDGQRMERARQEQLLRDALISAKAANSAKSDFLSRMSHDIRTPMNAIIGMSAIGQMKLGDTEQVRDCFEKIDASSRYLLSLINDILDMSKIETGKMTLAHERFSLAELTDELTTILLPQAQGHNIRFDVVRRQEPLGSYLGDPLRLKQILMNLLSNALKFTPSGGQVRLELGEDKRQSGFSNLIFIVADNGIGMSEEFMTRLFQPFEQEAAESARNNVGSGLGLSIVYHLVQLMGGDIQVKSRKGEGTAFTVLIPLAPAEEERERPPENAPEADPPAAEPPRASAFAGKRVLLVEDNELNMEIARSLLEMNGLAVEPAENGAVAVERFSSSPVNHYFAVLMDIRMPVMDGLAATRGIRELDRPDAAAVPIIAMSANAFSEDKRMAAQAGMTSYLVKPLDIQALLRELGKYLGG